MPSPVSPSRRSALALLSTGILSSWAGLPDFAFAETFAPGAAARPRLATPEQIAAEQQLLVLLNDPDLKKLQSAVRNTLAATARGRMPAAAARLDYAIAEWTNSLIFSELVRYRPYPAFIWATDDTPRSWLGHVIGGSGASGDNPDNIYRAAAIDGSGRYEILGQIDQAHRPSQFVLELDHTDMTHPAGMFGKRKKAEVATAALTTDRQMKIAADGSFRITINGPGNGPNHLNIGPGQVGIDVRDVLSDWHQRPARLSIRRVDDAAPLAFGPADVRRHMLEDLTGYIQFWAGFPDIWMGGLQPNSIARPRKRNGGWGFITGLRFQLSPGQAMVVTTTRGAARYTGFQLTDPWMIAPDAKRHQCSLNISQAAPDADGTFTYVISLTDPGVANWLDPAGIDDGFGILRWQNVPPEMTANGLVRDLRVLSLADVAKLPGIARVTPEQRSHQLAARVRGYNTRVE